MKCPNCRTENPEGVKFCGECGESLQAELVCPRCGHENPQGVKFCYECGHALAEEAPAPTQPPSPPPTSFASGRYQVKKFLGEGGKKKVYLAHDTTLDRDVAFALIKIEKMDRAARTRIKREAQAMGRLGDHPNIVTVFDFGEDEGQPYIVMPLLTGGDVEGLIERAPNRQLPCDGAIEITRAVCKGLEFAHSKGIIHRDLKPGNVWIAADGTAKIGDFGLAVAVYLSRLTKSGIMLGTVIYIPPEQAMGGKVTNRADLYSLGAMLYEMVTGRPPFVGDDPVAIVGQHINTPPVLPTWHRADLPPALESLIMQLLEKDPEKRPESATVVLQALDALGAAKTDTTASQVAPSATPSPFYQRVFVGREAERKRLQAGFDAAVSGQGSLMMVVGEPGIGKTALCEQLSTYVALRGGMTIVGHCYEEGSLSLPYLAFIEAIRSYVLSQDEKELSREMGTGASDVARIVSEVREKLKVEPRPPGIPEEDRYQLLQAVAGFLGSAAATRPLLVVLEDLHDADRGTLEMLAHVARSLSGRRLLLVGTYRDVEVDRSHPLSAKLAELRRLASYDRVLLRGLNVDEVGRMLESMTRQDVPWGLAEAVHKQTEGNPLFVQEVVRHLVEEGLIAQEGERVRIARDTPAEIAIPEGLRDVIGKRLSALSQECNRLLSIAAVIGREFRLDVLQKVADASDEDLLAALAEARAVAVVDERSGIGAAVTYRFTHALFRQTLYEEIIAPRRIRLHQQVGQALEEVHSRRLEEHAAELAEHFSHSSNPLDLDKAVGYGEMAARRASSVYAYGEEVRLLEQTLKVQEVLEPDNRTKRCDLLLALGNALIFAGEPRRALDTELPAAFSLAEASGDSDRASQACQQALTAVVLDGSYDTPEATEWAERADRHAQPDTAARAWADMLMGYNKFATGSFTEGVRLLTRALELARRFDESDLFSNAAGYWMMVALAPRHTAQRLRLAQESAELTRRWHVGMGIAMGRGPSPLVNAFLVSGQRAGAEEVIREHRQLTERTGQAHDQGIAMLFERYLACLDGRLEDVVTLARRMLDWGEEMGLAVWSRASLTTDNAFARALLHLGQADEALQLSVWPGQPALCLAHLGQRDQVARSLDRRVMARPGIGSIEDETPALVDIMYLEAAVLVGHQQAAELLMQRFVGTGTREAAMTCVDRHLGAAAALLGKPEEARSHYQEAIRVCTEMRFRPEIALTWLQLAELLLEHYPDEKAVALEHLDFAIGEFREMKMRPSLERALKCREATGR